MADLTTLLSKFLDSLYAGAVTLTRSGLAATSTDSVVIANDTASTAGVPVQQSGRLRFRSNVWNTTATAANNTNDFWIESVPASGTTPSGLLKFGKSLNGGAATYPLTLSSGGTATLTGLTASGTIQGADIVASGTIQAGATGGFLGLGSAGEARSARKLVKPITGIADNTATTVFTVTIPNANHAAAIKVTFLSSNGGADAFESSRVATGHVVVARTTGANAVATAATIDDAAIATVAGGATHTLAYAVSAIAGAVNAVNTFTITVTIDDTGNLGANTLIAVAELINSQASGVTIQ